MPERVFRPVRTRTFAIVLSAVLITACIAGWVVLPERIQSLFTPFQLVTLLVIVAFMVAVMMLVGLSTVWVNDRGFRIRNGPFVRQVAWSEVKAIRFRYGDPWAYIVLDDGTDDPRRVPMLGIQATDRGRADGSVAWLREELASRRRT